MPLGAVSSRNRSSNSQPRRAKMGTATVAAAPTHGSGSSRHKWTERATVTGNDGGVPTGQVIFYLCSGNAGCSSTAQGATALAGTLSNGVATSAQSVTLTTNGAYCFAAVYQGSTDYTSSSDLSTTVQCFAG